MKMIFGMFRGVIVIDLITGIATAVKSTADLAGSVKILTDKVENAELNLKVAKLYDELASMSILISELKTQVYEKELQIKSLLTEKEQKLLFEDNIYVCKNDDNEIVSRFCPRCKDADNQKINLTNLSENRFICQNCKVTFFTSNPNLNTPIRSGGKPISSGIRNRKF